MSINWFSQHGLLIFLLVFCLSNNTLAEEPALPSDATALTYFTEIYPPSSYYQSSDLVGLSVETLQLIWAELGIEKQPIFVVPWARGLKQINENNNTVLFAMSKTKERTPNYRWVGPIFEVNYVIVAHKNELDTIRDIDEIKGHNIVVIRNDITEIIVKEAGVAHHHIIEAKNAEQSLNLLRSGRVNLIAISRSGYRDAVARGIINLDDFSEIYLLRTVSDYYAFSKDTSDEIIQLFQQGLDNVREEQRALRRRYHVD